MTLYLIIYLHSHVIILIKKKKNPLYNFDLDRPKCVVPMNILEASDLNTIK